MLNSLSFLLFLSSTIVGLMTDLFSDNPNFSRDFDFHSELSNSTTKKSGFSENFYSI